MGEPVIRAATRQAMRILGEQFVLGRNIKAAIRARAWLEGASGSLSAPFSFDMLGEGARTARDAARYHQRYMDAIAAVAAARQDGPVEAVDGVSVKLSALHPRYKLCSNPTGSGANSIRKCSNRPKLRKLPISASVLMPRNLTGSLSR